MLIAVFGIHCNFFTVLPIRLKALDLMIFCFQKKKEERISKQNTTTQEADIRSLFRCIENQNREQNNEVQGEI